MTLLSFSLNSALCLDLYLTVKNPFVSGSGRTKLYLIAGFVMSGTLTSWEIIKIVKRGTFDTEQWNIVVAYGIFFIVALYTTIFAAKRIMKKGVS